jgi:hypothetical protein
MLYPDTFPHFAVSLAYWAADAAAAAVVYLARTVASPTPPILPTLAPVYDRMLAVALLLSSAVIAFALIEGLLGGSRGAGPAVIPRTVASVAAAMAGLGVLQYAIRYADLLASVWNGDFVGGASSLVTKLGPAYTAPSGEALGSALGLILVGLLTLLLTILIQIELVLRTALITVTAAFLPLGCVMAIWPRLARTVSHLVSFLVALLLSKFVIATAVYIGFSMVVHGFVSHPGDGAGGAYITGLATLGTAAFAPLLLIQGVRFAEASASQAARGVGATAARLTAGHGPAVARVMRAVRTIGGATRKHRRGGGEPTPPGPTNEASA